MTMKPDNQREFQIVFLALFLTLFFAHSGLLFAEPPSEFSQLAGTLSTPDAVARFMQRHFRYTEDIDQFGQADYWQTPEEMLKNREGDCEDFALFAKAALEKHGYQVLLFSIYSEKQAHTVAVYWKDGEKGIFDLDRIVRETDGKLSDIGTRFDRKWDYLGVMRQEGSLGLISRKFQKSEANLAYLESLFSLPLFA